MRGSSTVSAMAKNKKHRKVKEVLKDVSENIRHTVAYAVHNTSQSIGNVIHDVDHAAQWIALAPLAVPMRTILKARGIPRPKKIDELAKTFYANIIAKGRFEAFVGNHFSVHQAAVKLGKHSAKVRNDFLHFHFFEREHADAVDPTTGLILAGGAALAAPTGGVSALVAPIVAAIVKYFQKKKEDKQAGIPLPADEEKAVNEMDAITENASDSTGASKNYSINPALATQGRGGGSSTTTADASKDETTTTTTTDTDDEDDDSKSSSIFSVLLWVGLGFAFVIFLFVVL